MSDVKLSRIESVLEDLEYPVTNDQAAAAELEGVTLLPRGTASEIWGRSSNATIVIASNRWTTSSRSSTTSSHGKPSASRISRRAKDEPLSTGSEPRPVNGLKQAP